MLSRVSRADCLRRELRGLGATEPAVDGLNELFSLFFLVHSDGSHREP